MASPASSFIGYKRLEQTAPPEPAPATETEKSPTAGASSETSFKSEASSSSSTSTSDAAPSQDADCSAGKVTKLYSNVLKTTAAVICMDVAQMSTLVSLAVSYIPLFGSATVFGGVGAYVGRLTVATAWSAADTGAHSYAKDLLINQKTPDRERQMLRIASHIVSGVVVGTALFGLSFVTPVDLSQSATDLVNLGVVLGVAKVGVKFFDDHISPMIPWPSKTTVKKKS